MLQSYNLASLQSDNLTFFYNLTIFLQSYNFTILQSYNFTILQSYNYTILQSYNYTILPSNNLSILPSYHLKSLNYNHFHHLGNYQICAGCWISEPHSCHGHGQCELNIRPRIFRAVKLVTGNAACCRSFSSCITIPPMRQYTIVLCKYDK